MEFLAAKCPNCGGDLRLPDDKTQVKCMYCGFDVIVRDAVNAVDANVENLLKLALTAEKARNNQEAYNYFTKALEYEPNNYIALLGKAASAGRLSTTSNLRLEELTKGIESAVEIAPTNKKEEIEKQAAELISEVCTNHEVSMLQEKHLINCLEIAYNYNPENASVISLIISKTHRLILVNQEVIDIMDGNIESYNSQIKTFQSYGSKDNEEQAKRNLEQETKSLKQKIEEMEYYIHLKSKYFAKLQSVNPEAASSLNKTIKQSEEETGEKIRNSQKIRRMQPAGGGCLITVISIFTTIVIFMYLYSLI